MKIVHTSAGINIAKVYFSLNLVSMHSDESVAINFNSIS